MHDNDIVIFFLQVIKNRILYNTEKKQTLDFVLMLTTVTFLSIVKKIHICVRQIYIIMLVNIIPLCKLIRCTFKSMSKYYIGLR